MFRTVLPVCFLLAGVSAQFPRRCTDKASLEARECCPTHTDGTKCGEMSNRGICAEIIAPTIDITVNETLELLLDDRAYWPRAFYNRACSCYGNFDDVDCSSCKAGFQGENCDVKSAMAIRRNFTSLERNEIDSVVSVLDKSKRIISENYVILVTSYDRILRGESPEFANISVYNLFVWMHAYVSRDNLVFQGDDVKARLTNVNEENRVQVAIELLKEDFELAVESDVDYAHEGPAFLPWHRYFLLKWEKELRDVVVGDDTFTLPYWDWRDNTNCDVCNDAMMGDKDPDNATLISSGSPISKWQIICSKGNDYIESGIQCTGQPEGPLLRDPGNYDPEKISGLPTSQEVENVIKIPDSYDTDSFDVAANQSFRNLVEGFADTTTGDADPSMSYLHNAVHLFMNGTMSEVATSANDPIFLLHHAFVDSIYELWLRQRALRGNFGPTNGIRLGHRPNDFMVPFFPLVRNREGFANTFQLGYAYDYILDDVINDVGSGDELDNALQVAIDGSRADFAGKVQDTIGFFARPPQVQNSNPISARFYGNRNGKRNFRLVPRTFGEGGFSLDENLPNVVLTAGESQMLLAENRAAALDVISIPSSTTVWQKIKAWFANLGQALRNLSRREVAWLVIVCLLLVATAWSCACICGPRRQKNRGCCSFASCTCCCYDYGPQEGEEVALLETKRDVIVKGHLVKAKTYM